MEKTKENSFYVKYIKRLLDILIALGVLVVFCWLYLICAIVIVADSGFPVIFRQERTGRNGKPFKIYKFRTMVKHADKIGPASTSIGDARITKSGKWLRTTSLDEITQVINVLKGDMSIIGFRPDVVHENQDYTQEKFLLRPGITGYAQVNGRSTLSAEERVYWENRYTYEVSFMTDLKIILKTVRVVLKKTGTN